MVNPITTGTVSGNPVADATRPQGPQRRDALGRSASGARGDGGAVSTTISRLAAGGPPLDSNRIETLRAAIKAGTYRIDPQVIADRMIDSDMAAERGAAL